MLKAAAILEPQFAKYPNHPGVAHYLIHVYDAPPLAQKGLPAAQALRDHRAGCAACAAHAVAHLHPRRRLAGLGGDQPSAPADVGATRQAKAPRPSTPATTWCTPTCSWPATPPRASRRWTRHVRSSIDAGVRRHLCRSRRCRRATRSSAATGARRRSLQPPTGGAPVHPGDHLLCPRARRGAQSATCRAAEQAGRRARQARRRRCARRGTTTGQREVEIQQLAAAAWIAFARRRNDEALRARCARRPTWRTSNEKHIVTPGRILPARELLGDMLLEAGQPAAALAE